MDFRIDHQFTGKYTNDADFGEEFGELCLGLARGAFGHHEVNKDLKGSVNETAKKTNFLALVVFIITLPISGLLTIAGAISLAASTTHAEKYDAYAKALEKQTQ